jgi:hypothetical protein
VKYELGFIYQKTAFFIVTAVKAYSLTTYTNGTSTDYLTLGSRDLLEKLTVAHLLQTYPPFIEQYSHDFDPGSCPEIRNSLHPFTVIL